MENETEAASVRTEAANTLDSMLDDWNARSQSGSPPVGFNDRVERLWETRPGDYLFRIALLNITSRTRLSNDPTLRTVVNEALSDVDPHVRYIAAQLIDFAYDSSPKMQLRLYRRLTTDADENVRATGIEKIKLHEKTHG